MSSEKNEPQKTVKAPTSQKKFLKKRICIKIPCESEYDTASIAQLIAVVFVRSKRNLYTQQDIADEIRVITKNKRVIYQGTISKTLAKLSEADLTVNGRPATVYQTAREGYGFFERGESNNDYYLRLRYSGLFLEPKVYCNNPQGASTLFIFKVAPENQNEVKKQLTVLLSADAIFDFIASEDNLIVLLNVSSASFEENTMMLRKFVD